MTALVFTGAKIGPKLRLSRVLSAIALMAILVGVEGTFRKVGRMEALNGLEGW
jgi:hypothetical protein